MLPRLLTTLLQTYPIEVAVVGMAAAVIGIIQFEDYQRSTTWPDQWQCHTRIQLGRLNHGRPEIYEQVPGKAPRPLPYLAGVWEYLCSNDSLSKPRGTTVLYVVRDSATARTISQWNWNKKTREFEFAGRTTD